MRNVGRLFRLMLSPGVNVMRTSWGKVSRFTQWFRTKYRTLRPNSSTTACNTGVDLMMIFSLVRLLYDCMPVMSAMNDIWALELMPAFLSVVTMTSAEL